MAKRRKYEIPGDLELLVHLGHIKEPTWTPQLVKKGLKKFEEAVDTWGSLPGSQWAFNNPRKWAQMEGTALMVRDCRAAFRAKQNKKALHIYKLILERLEREDKQPLQKMRAAARERGRQTSEEAQATKAGVVELLESGEKLTSEQIGDRVGCSSSNVRRIKQNWKRAKDSLET